MTDGDHRGEKKLLAEINSKGGWMPSNVGRGAFNRTVGRKQAWGCRSGKTEQYLRLTGLRKIVKKKQKLKHRVDNGKIKARTR